MGSVYLRSHPSTRTLTETLLLAAGAVFVLGVGAQWLAWRFRLPSILLLLAFGFLAGPVTGMLDPDLLQGDGLFAFVSLAVGIILFEGGLTLRLRELEGVGNVVRNLITIGVAITGVLTGLTAYALLGVSASVAAIIGGILTVTGPTVIIPLLRHVRPTGRVGSIAKWEGIVVDPVGAILAVLVLETILLINEPGVHGLGALVFHTFEGIVKELFIGIGGALAGAALLVMLLRRRLLPDYLQNSVALMVVVAVFALTEMLQHESGLLATTLMGIFMANQNYAPIRRIVEFKEDLRVLLISILFIILSARLDQSALDYVTPGSLAFLAVMMLAIRPLAVYLSTLGTRIDWREKAFLAWLAPRGIVAAAVASIFSIRVNEVLPGQGDVIVPIIFLVIVGTVLVYGLTISPLARWLGLAHPDPQGVLIVGAHAWAWRIGRALKEQGVKVLLIDANPMHVRNAHRAKLEAVQANVLSETILDELDLGGIGRLLALTPNDEVNSLAALNFAEAFGTNDVYQLSARVDPTAETEGELPTHLRGRPLFGAHTTYRSIEERLEKGATLEVVRLTETFDASAFAKQFGKRSIPLFVVPGAGKVRIVAEGLDDTKAAPGDLLIAFVDQGIVLPTPDPDDAEAMGEPRMGTPPGVEEGHTPEPADVHSADPPLVAMERAEMAERKKQRERMESQAKPG